jgi:flagellar hook assembly protein FlgD
LPPISTKDLIRSLTQLSQVSRINILTRTKQSMNVMNYLIKQTLSSIDLMECVRIN